MNCHYPRSFRGAIESLQFWNRRGGKRGLSKEAAGPRLIQSGAVQLSDIDADQLAAVRRYERDLKARNIGIVGEFADHETLTAQVRLALEDDVSVLLSQERSAVSSIKSVTMFVRLDAGPHGEYRLLFVNRGSVPVAKFSIVSATDMNGLVDIEQAARPMGFPAHTNPPIGYRITNRTRLPQRLIVVAKWSACSRTRQTSFEL